jgi:hypothetical protein
MDSQTTTQALRMSALLFVDISGSTALYESLGEVTVKGRREPVQILEYVWERSPELTTIRRNDTIPRISRLWRQRVHTRCLASGRDHARDGMERG